MPTAAGNMQISILWRDFEDTWQKVMTLLFPCIGQQNWQVQRRQLSEPTPLTPSSRSPGDSVCKGSPPADVVKNQNYERELVILDSSQFVLGMHKSYTAHPNPPFSRLSKRRTSPRGILERTKAAAVCAAGKSAASL